MKEEKIGWRNLRDRSPILVALVVSVGFLNLIFSYLTKWLITCFTLPIP